MRFVLFGGESLLIQCGELLRASGHTIAAVVSPDADALRWAGGQGVKAMRQSEKLTDELAKLPFDWLLSIVNFTILPPSLLELPEAGAVNFHDGPLPSYGGRNAPVWAILGGATEHGIAWHRMEANADTGEVLVQRRFPIDPTDTGLTLNAKCFEAAIESFSELVHLLEEGRDPRQPQALDLATYRTSRERPRALGMIDWDSPLESIDRLGRALDFGAYRNPLCTLKLWLGNDHLVVRSLVAISAPHDAVPGTVMEVSGEEMNVAVDGGTVRLSGFAQADGTPVSFDVFTHERGIVPGSRLPVPGRNLADEIDARSREMAGSEALWVDRLASLQPSRLDLPESYDGTSSSHSQVVSQAVRQFLTELCDDEVTALCAAVALFIGVVSGHPATDIAVPVDAPGSEPVQRLMTTWTPLRVAPDPEVPAGAALRSIIQALDSSRTATPFLADLWIRTPRLRGALTKLPVAITRIAAGAAVPDVGHEITIGVGPGGRVCWHRAAGGVDLSSLGDRFDVFLEQLRLRPAPTAGQLHQLHPAEVELIEERWRSGESGDVDGSCIHGQFQVAAHRNPEAVALAYELEDCTFGTLNGWANQLARKLRQCGVAPGQPVGICVERSIDLVVAVLGVLKAGAAYVPLDPSYPPDRLSFMIEDSQMTVAITQEHLSNLIPSRIETVRVDRDRGLIRALDSTDLQAGTCASDLAYLIYTSGSTGRPKGVMIEHGNVLNFFSGLDRKIGASPPGVWLAVTSLSFDISVLELLWTLTRGFKVVIYGDEVKSRVPVPAGQPDRTIDFSLFYFSASGDAEAAGKSDKYRLLLEGARFADEHGFKAVWTPERHFHAFGGLYPNPSVTGAAVAAITRNVGIRAGSCVLPLHHPARVVEEWSVVDNLSNGRVGLSIAAGWQPDDFVLRPESFADAKSRMFRDLETVRKLWRGDSIMMPGPRGDVKVRCLPRPVQPDLPIWVTTAGNVETFEAAGRVGAGVLTHLLGQSVPEIQTKISAYRRARREAGHAGEGCVSLMLHTFVGDDTAEVKELVRAPMKAYLQTSIGLIRNFASAFPTFKRKDDQLDFNALSAEEFESLLDYSFERYFETSGLFGDLDRCSAMVEQLREIGVDEIACLVDFGVDADTTLIHLKHLNRLRTLSAGSSGAGDYTIESLIERHKVTHLQCTPAMASMLLASDSTRAALKRLSFKLIGGEALTTSLAEDLRHAVPGRIFNMYGPTETTIWSTCSELVRGGSPGVPIGRPILNTQVFVLDAALRPVPPGAPGELCIGGAGVARGYWRRPELTGERFVAYPRRPGTRLYRTGDRVRFAPDGSLEFIGRLDNQVKVRGHRIELGEVESVLNSHPGVREAAVVLREHGAGDVRIVAYAVLRADSETGERLRAWLKTRLPEFMVPAQVVLIPDLPRTPNQKIDRKALTLRREAPVGARLPPSQAAGSDLEKSIAAIWRQALRIEKVGLDDSFFDLGGHSLLAVQVHGRLKKEYKQDLAITDLFRYPTVRKLASFIQGRVPAVPVGPASDRGATRRAAIGTLRRRPNLREKSAG